MARPSTPPMRALSSTAPLLLGVLLGATSAHAACTDDGACPPPSSPAPSPPSPLNLPLALTNLAVYIGVVFVLAILCAACCTFMFKIGDRKRRLKMEKEAKLRATISAPQQT